MDIAIDFGLENMVGLLIERESKIENTHIKAADMKISELKEELGDFDTETDEDQLKSYIELFSNIKKRLARGKVISSIRKKLLENIRKGDNFSLNQLLKNVDLINDQIAKSVSESYKDDPNADKVLSIWNSKQLWKASLLGDGKSVRSLLERKADVNYKNINGDTPLHLALKNDVKMNKKARRKTVQLLLNSDNIDIFAVNNKGSTILMDAAEKGYEDIVKLLLEKIQEKTRDNKQEFVRILNERDQEGNTAVMLAVQGNHANILEILAENGADVSITNNKLSSPLMYAAQDGDLKSAEILIKYGANVNYRDNDGWTAYFAAISHAEYEMANFLKENGAEEGKEGAVKFIPVPW